MASFLLMFYAVIYNCVSYVILRLFLISIKTYFIFTELSTILDYISGSLGGSLTFTLFIRFYYIYVMTVNLVQWRAVAGIFNCRSSAMSHMSAI